MKINEIMDMGKRQFTDEWRLKREEAVGILRDTADCLERQPQDRQTEANELLLVKLHILTEVCMSMFKATERHNTIIGVEDKLDGAERIACEHRLKELDIEIQNQQREIDHDLRD